LLWLCSGGTTYLLTWLGYNPSTLPATPLKRLGASTTHGAIPCLLRTLTLRSLWLAVLWFEDEHLAPNGCRECWGRFLSCRQCASWGRWIQDSGNRASTAGGKNPLLPCTGSAGSLRWQGYQQLDPGTASSKGISMRTHAEWVYPLPADVECPSRAAPPLTPKYWPCLLLVKIYLQLHVGCAHLQVEKGHTDRQVPRAERRCRL
jgi:hypothetical protein